MGTTKDGRQAGPVGGRQKLLHADLFILGSGVFPTSSTATPTSTIAGLAFRAVDAIESKLRYSRYTTKKALTGGPTSLD